MVKTIRARMCSQKQKMMIEFTIQDLVKYLVDDRQSSIREAMTLVYNSELFEKLLDVETGLYLESPLYVYDILKDELAAGHLVQNEV